MPSAGRDQGSGEVSAAVRLGAAMKGAREAAGISRRQFAEKVTWSHSNLADYENGHRVAPVAVVRAYEEKLELTPGSLLELRQVASDEAYGRMRERRPRSSSPPSQTRSRTLPAAQPDVMSKQADPGTAGRPDQLAPAAADSIPTGLMLEERPPAVSRTAWRWIRRRHSARHVETVGFRYRRGFVGGGWGQRIGNGPQPVPPHSGADALRGPPNAQ